MDPNGSTVTVDTPSLSICCELSGPPDGYPCVLLHGWPDDVRTWDRIIPALHAANLRIIAPYLRGFGPTRFRDPAAMRNGQLSALGQDVLELDEALGLKRFAVVGHDWGARAAYIASCLAGPARISHCAALSVGWDINDPSQSLSLRQVQNYWYQWYMALERGAGLLHDDRRGYTRYIWSIWNPGWEISDAEFERNAVSFDNPDWAEVVLHSYRVRWNLAATDPALEAIETRLSRHPQIGAPTLVLHGGADPCNDPATSEGKERLFTGPYERIVLPGVGHFPQRQAAEGVASHLVRFLTS